jgi:hypothetical protein
MASKVHYEDNLFFLHSILRTIESGLRLDIDPEYFRDKILEDIFFIDAALMRTFSSLKDNQFLINRVSYVRSLRRTVVAFSDFLDRVTTGDMPFSAALEAYREKLLSTSTMYHRTRKEIDTLLDQLEPDDEAQDVVSSEEYGFLLASTDDSDSDGDSAAEA